MLGDLIILVESLGISLGVGLYSWGDLPGWLWGAICSLVVRAPAVI